MAVLYQHARFHGTDLSADMSSARISETIGKLPNIGSGEHISIGELVGALSPTERITLLLVPSLLAVSPASVVFGVASVTGLMIAVIASQLLIGKRTFWLPAHLRQFELKRSIVQRAVNLVQRPTAWLERHARYRLTILTTGRLRNLPILVSAVLGVSLPFLELVPLSATLGGLAVSLMVLGTVLRDGLVTLAGILLALLVFALSFKLVKSAVALIGTVSIPQ